MKKIILFTGLFLILTQQALSWGFYAHQRINYYAVFLLPPEMLVLYKPQIGYIAEHAVDPDKRRYTVAAEAPRHYIDIDHYGIYPYKALPRNWKEAIARFGEDSLQAYGIVPYWIPVMLERLTRAFREKDPVRILKYSADLGHYIADAHVPLHANSNHNGQRTDQIGIHAFWESRVPELLAEPGQPGAGWDFFIGKANYISDPSAYAWKIVLESAAAADTVLRLEKELSKTFPSDGRFAFEARNGLLTRQYSAAYTRAYDAMLKGMVERRMRQSIYAIACFWYTAWINAGQPNLSQLSPKKWPEEEQQELESLNNAWKKAREKGWEHTE